jgi:hypothetical protein
MTTFVVLAFPFCFRDCSAVRPQSGLPATATAEQAELEVM